MSLKDDIKKQLPADLDHVANDIAGIFIDVMENHASVIKGSFNISPNPPAPAVFANSVYSQLPGAHSLGLDFLMAIETSVAQITAYLTAGATSLNSPAKVGIAPAAPVTYSGIEIRMIGSAAMPADPHHAEIYKKIAKAISRGIMVWAVSLVPSEDLRLIGAPIEVAV